MPIFIPAFATVPNIYEVFVSLFLLILQDGMIGISCYVLVVKSKSKLEESILSPFTFKSDY